MVETKKAPEAQKKFPEALKKVPEEPKKVPEKPKVSEEPKKVQKEPKKVPEATKKVSETPKIEALRKVPEEPMIAHKLVTTELEKHPESRRVAPEKKWLHHPAPTPPQHLETSEQILQAKKFQHQGSYVCKKTSFNILLTNVSSTFIFFL